MFFFLFISLTSIFISKLNVKTQWRMCRSVMRADVKGRTISFDSCILGEHYFKDFSIWNRSGFDLIWNANIEPFENQYGLIEFSDIDTGELLTIKAIPPYYFF